MLKDINLNLYKTFVNIYETKSISKAAKNMFLTQPAVSLNLRALEKQLNLKLFVKLQNSYIPTNEGEILYDSLKNSIDYLSNAEKLIYFNDDFKGKIKIGIQTHIFTAFISKLLAKFSQKYPKVEFEIWNGSTTEMIKHLDTNYLDIVFDTYPIFRPSNNIVINFIAKSKNCFFCKFDANYPNFIKVENLNSYPLITHLHNSKHIEELKNKIGQIELSPHIICSSTEAIVEIVKNGIGIGYALSDYIKSEIKNKKLRIIETDKALPETELYYCYNKNINSKIRDCFLEFIKKHLHK